MTSTKRKTAIAEPVPKSLTPPNAVRHIASAITFAFACADSGASAMHEVEDLEDVDDHRDEDDAQHRREQRHGDAPEDLPLGRAVGARGLEHVARHRRRARRRSPPSRSRPRSRCRRSAATGVISFGPEPRVAAERLREGLRADRGVVGARRARSRSRRCRRRRRRRLARPSRVALRELAPSRPAARARPCSTTPGLPPPGLKSRQTMPTMSPGFGAGSTACTAPFGTSSGAMPVRPSSATPPGLQRRLQHESRRRESAAGRTSTGSALESTPAG